MEANRENDLYFVKTKEESPNLTRTKSMENKNNMMSWHKKLAHMNENDMKTILIITTLYKLHIFE